MRKWTFVIFVILFTACEPEGYVKYMQFSSDDLSFLYYDKDTLTYTGIEINYQDTLYYLLNTSDTIIVPVQTNILSAKSEWSILHQEAIFGSSTILFDSNTGFVRAMINISRDEEQFNAGKALEINMTDNNYFSFRKYINSQDSVISLDTAWVLGKLYQDVYKFYGPNENNYSRVKSAYFAKKFGYIKIESTDGKKMELIKIKSKENQ